VERDIVSVDTHHQPRASGYHRAVRARARAYGGPVWVINLWRPSQGTRGAVSDELSGNHRGQARTLRDALAGQRRTGTPVTAAPELLHIETG
jgi:hypothetical protein